jgi:3-deoxy-alpha-D-manno-octulosonate 8-oxidase
MMKNSKNVHRYMFGAGSFENLGKLVDEQRREDSDSSVFFVDHYFQDKPLKQKIPAHENDLIIFVDTDKEPFTDQIDSFNLKVKSSLKNQPVAIVGIGGGAVLDTAKAVSNLLTNPGNASDYQGWDLVKNPGVYKIGVPTLSGTGAEASRTCVMINPKTGLKLGMNSDHTIYDQLLMDPDLSATVSRNQYFYSGMDSYIHCIESLRGSFRHPVGDSFSHQCLDLVRKVFHSDDMLDAKNRADLMIASYLGGCAIANSFVGVVHPFSAGLSVVLGLHHCVANCIALLALDEFYPKEAEEFSTMAKAQDIEIPKGVCKNLSDAQFLALRDATVIHEKPLANALGESFLELLTPQKCQDIFARM